MGRVQYHEPYEGTIIEVELVHKLGLREPPPVIVVLPRYDHNGYGGNALSGKPGGAIIVHNDLCTQEGDGPPRREHRRHDASGGEIALNHRGYNHAACRPPVNQSAPTKPFQEVITPVKLGRPRHPCHILDGH